MRTPPRSTAVTAAPPPSSPPDPARERAVRPRPRFRCRLAGAPRDSSARRVHDACGSSRGLAGAQRRRCRFSKADGARRAEARTQRHVRGQGSRLSSAN
nr:unnamed protein product [Digitaria exilis]